MTGAQDVLDAARALGPTIAQRAADIEAARRIPRDVLDMLERAGCFGLLLPASHCGLGADLVAAMQVFETLACADASVGWTVMIGASAWVDLVGLPRATFDRLFVGDRAVIVAGALAPTGQMEAVDGGGYRVSGRWGFASGCEHADWLWGDCIELDGAAGEPRLRGALFAPDQVVIEDTWRVSGLAGTGSHHFHVSDLDLPADMAFPVGTDEPCIDTTIAHVPVPALIALEVAAVALGIAQGALDDVVALAQDKVPLLAEAPLAANPLFQRDLATADTELRAARSLLYETAESTWATARSGDPLTLEKRARIRATAVWASERAAEVVDAAYRGGGSSSIYADCPLQRRLRDIRALSQHFIVKHDTLTTAGAVLAGRKIEVPVF